MHNIEEKYEGAYKQMKPRQAHLQWQCCRRTVVLNTHSLRHKKDHKKMQLNLKKTAGPSVNIKNNNVKGNTNY